MGIDLENKNKITTTLAFSIVQGNLENIIQETMHLKPTDFWLLSITLDRPRTNISMSFFPPFVLPLGTVVISEHQNYYMRFYMTIFRIVVQYDHWLWGEKEPLYFLFFYFILENIWRISHIPNITKQEIQK